MNPSLSCEETQKENKGGKASIFSVDSAIHSREAFAHNGGVSHAAQLINSLRTNNYATNEITTVFRQTFSIPTFAFP